MAGFEQNPVPTFRDLMHPGRLPLSGPTMRDRRYNIVDIEDVKGAAKQMAKWIERQKTKS